MATELVQSLTIIIIRITSCLEFLLCIRILLRLSGVFHLIFMVIHEIVYLTYFELSAPNLFTLRTTSLYFTQRSGPSAMRLAFCDLMALF